VAAVAWWQHRLGLLLLLLLTLRVCFMLLCCGRCSCVFLLDQQLLLLLGCFPPAALLLLDRLLQPPQLRSAWQRCGLNHEQRLLELRCCCGCLLHRLLAVQVHCRLGCCCKLTCSCISCLQVCAEAGLQAPERLHNAACAGIVPAANRGSHHSSQHVRVRHTP
jgi:hypothetical protein